MTTISRRNVIGSAGALGAAALVGGGAAGSATAQTAVRGIAPAGKDLTPDQALDLLREGNAAFLQGSQTNVLTDAQRRLTLAGGQEPFAAYVTCSDSRVPPELLFGRGLGELFIIRNAGNTVDTVALGSIEYAVAVLKVPLVVVMGHESCGAVKAATEVVSENATFPGSIGRMVEPIIPAVLQARGQEGDKLENAVRQNVRRVVGQLRNQTDPLMLEPQQSGRLKVVGAYYSLGSGKVDFFDLPENAG
ncbi:carbonic anhydrase [Qipengyuania sp.]|uniref:carbonic anhydrase n=1 Tax=Qipengyuania sp. TaxID=2004515 RepID=UPI0035C79D3B